MLAGVGWLLFPLWDDTSSHAAKHARLVDDGIGGIVLPKVATTRTDQGRAPVLLPTPPPPPQPPQPPSPPLLAPPPPPPAASPSRTRLNEAVALLRDSLHVPAREQGVVAPFYRNQSVGIHWIGGPYEPIGDCAPLNADRTADLKTYLCPHERGPHDERPEAVRLRQLRAKGALALGDFSRVRPAYFADVLALVPGARVALVGDSIMSQFHSGLVCSLAQTGDMLTAVKEPSPITGWRAGPEHAAPQPLQAPHGVHLLFGSDRHYNADQIEQLLAASDIILINFGLHYGHDYANLYRRTMHAFISQVLPWARREDKLFVILPTSTQHFDTPHGDFEAWSRRLIAETVWCNCTRRVNLDPFPPNAVLASLLSELDPNHTIATLPIEELTLPLHDWHSAASQHGKMPPGTPFICDCTHFCYNPHMFELMYGMLADLILAKWPAGRSFRDFE